MCESGWRSGDQSSESKKWHLEWNFNCLSRTTNAPSINHATQSPNKEGKTASGLLSMTRQMLGKPEPPTAADKAFHEVAAAHTRTKARAFADWGLDWP